MRNDFAGSIRNTLEEEFGKQTQPVEVADHETKELVFTFKSGGAG
jgi:hypothetical protein